MKYILIAVLALSACNNQNAQKQPDAHTSTLKRDMVLQRDVFFHCMESIPNGASHTSIGSSDWNKVVAECHKVSYDLSQVDTDVATNKDEKIEANPETSTEEK